MKFLRKNLILDNESWSDEVELGEGSVSCVQFFQLDDTVVHLAQLANCRIGFLS